MKILYIAKHYQQATSNDEEGAIAYALEQCGHMVCRLTEAESSLALAYERSARPDLVLFHKWEDIPTLSQLVTPKVFWYFDLVQSKDATLAKRDGERVTWMEEVLPQVSLGFCTDGDWVKQRSNQSNKRLVWLPQAADARTIEPHTSPAQQRQDIRILFTGTKNGGVKRKSFVQEMQQVYGEGFVHVERRCHGQALQDTISRARIVVAPDYPVSDCYWSNRVYLTLGCGGFLLHPYSKGLIEQYPPGFGIQYYQDRTELHRKIQEYEGVGKGNLPFLRRQGLQHTLACHTYTRRVQQLLSHVKNRLGIE